MIECFLLLVPDPDGHTLAVGRKLGLAWRSDMMKSFAARLVDAQQVEYRPD
jgi:hypothetical protein